MGHGDAAGASTEVRDTLQGDFFVVRQKKQGRVCLRQVCPHQWATSHGQVNTQPAGQERFPLDQHEFTAVPTVPSNTDVHQSVGVLPSSSAGKECRFSASSIFDHENVLCGQPDAALLLRSESSLLVVKSSSLGATSHGAPC